MINRLGYGSLAGLFFLPPSPTVVSNFITQRARSTRALKRCVSGVIEPPTMRMKIHQYCRSIQTHYQSGYGNRFVASI